MLALFPKAWGLVSTIPGPVVAVYLILIMAPLFIKGMRTIVQDEFDYRKGLMVGVATMVGLGFQFELVTLPFGGLWESMFQQSLTAGGITMIALTLFTDLTSRGRSRLQAELHMESLPRINDFLENFSSKRGWSPDMSERLHTVAEETLLILAPEEGNGSTNWNGAGRRRLLVLAGGDGSTAELEFISAPSHAGNLEDRIAVLKKPVQEIPELESMVERDVSLRLLRHYASSVSHQQYHDTEVVTVRVSPLARE